MILPLYSQLGMQPIHYAAANGHAELLILLIEKFGVDPQEKAEVANIFSCKQVKINQGFRKAHNHCIVLQNVVN